MRNSKAESLSPHKQHNNPLHGLTLEAIVIELQAYYGWAGLVERISVRCFSNDLSVSSSLKFFRKTSWAREKVEELYIFMLQDIYRTDNTNKCDTIGKPQRLTTIKSENISLKINTLYQLLIRVPLVRA